MCCFGAIGGDCAGLFAEHQVRISGLISSLHGRISAEAGANCKFLLLPICVRNAVPMRRLDQPPQPNGWAKNKF